MAQREGSIYLTLFIVMFLLFAGMTALFISTNAKVTDLTSEIRSLKSKNLEKDRSNKELNQDVTALRVLIGGPTYEDRAWPGNDFFLQNRLKEIVESSMGSAFKGLGESGGPTYAYLVEPFDDVPRVVTKYQELLAKANADRRASNETREAEKQSSGEAVASIRGENGQLLQQVSQLESRIEDSESAAQEKEQQYVTQIEELNDQIADIRIGLGRELNFKQNTIKALENRLDKLLEESRKEKSLDDVDPDGEVLTVLTDSGKAWADIGRFDHLRKGLIFRVFQTGKGGKRVYKGRVEVRKVDERTSEMKILEEFDSLNPIASGDFIASPFYDPDQNPVFVFATPQLASPEVTKDFLVAKMETYGAQIGSKVDLTTDYLVATENYESSDAYTRASELGVTVIRERDLLEFIGR